MDVDSGGDPEVAVWADGVTGCPEGFGDPVEDLPPYTVDEGDDARLAAAIQRIQLQEEAELARRRENGQLAVPDQSFVEQEEWVAGT